MSPKKKPVPTPAPEPPVPCANCGKTLVGLRAAMGVDTGERDDDGKAIYTTYFFCPNNVQDVPKEPGDNPPPRYPCIEAWKRKNRERLLVGATG